MAASARPVLLRDRRLGRPPAIPLAPQPVEAGAQRAPVPRDPQAEAALLGTRLGVSLVGRHVTPVDLLPSGRLMYPPFR